jgi:hypothetical protein
VVGEGFLLNPAGLVTALVLIPFFILYLIKPKPVHERIPSLQFIMKDVGKSNINSFFRNWLKDILLLFQLLILLALIFAAARPYMEVPRTYLVDQTVIVIDVSGSMSANGRFDEAIDLAKENLGKENTLIAIKAIPEVILERGSSGKARDLLNQLKPTATTTPITDALQMAGAYAGAGSRIVVISDFAATQGDLDYETIAASLEGKGAIVDYLPVTGGEKNVGIIDLLVGPQSSSVWVKNYNDRPTEVTLRISDADQSLLLARGETKEVSFATPSGIAELKLLEKDDLDIDNMAWTSAPQENTVRILSITNKQNHVQNDNLRVALDIISKNFPTNFEIEYAIPPKIPKLNHDIYLFQDASLDLILPGHIKNIKEQVEKGASLIVVDQSNLFSIDWQGLLPVEALNQSEGGRASVIPGTDSALVEDIQFGQLSSYRRVAAVDGSIIVAKTEQDPVIVMQRLEKGIALYYGLDEQAASFSKDPSYPVFWRRTIDLLTERPSLTNLNIRTGSILALPKESTVKSPTGTLIGTLIPLDAAGLYVLPDRTVAVNMLSDAESNLATNANASTSLVMSGDEQTEMAPQELTHYALWIALIILFLEILYLKFRGDF